MTVPLRISGLTVRYADGHVALDGVDLAVGAGERVALVGRSGSGKTTLVRAVLGLLPAGAAVTGSVRVGGQEVLGLPEKRMRALRGRVVGYVPQDPYAACDPLRTVGHHVTSAWTAHRLRPPPGAVVAGLEGVGLAGAARRAAQHPHQWSGGMLQRATLVAATAHTPLLTLADEPTSALDADLADDALALVRRTCGALVLISHDLALVAEHAAHAVVLHEGRVVERGPATRVLRSPSAPATRALVAAAAPGPRTTAAAPGAAVTRVRGATRRYGATTALAGVDLEVRAGEVVGVMGPSGSGKSTLLRIAAGMERPDAGTVDLTADRPGYVMPVFQDPVASLDARWPLWRTLTEPLRARGERRPRARLRERAAAALAEVGLAGLDVDRRPGSLSVGQAQRVAVARALLARPALLVADEPTASLDVVAATAVTALLRRAADDGAGVLVVSHDGARLRSYADRIVTLGAVGRATPPSPPAEEETDRARTG